MAKRDKKKSTKRPAAPSASHAPAVKPVSKPRGDHEIELIARGLWLHGSSVLLCRNVDKDYLYLPGGHIEFGESAAEALEREFLEEAGVRVAAGALTLVTEGAFQTRKRWHHELNLVFRVTPTLLPPSPPNPPVPGEPPAQTGADSLTPPAIVSKEKGIGFEWVDLAAAVDLDIRPLSIKAWLAAGAGIDPAAARAEWVSELPL